MTVNSFSVKRFANTRNIDPKSIIEVSSSLGIESKPKINYDSKKSVQQL